MKRIPFCSFLGLLVSFVMSVQVWAQATAQISGTAKDQSGAVLPGVEITATQTETGVARNTITNETGSYLLSNLPTDPYRLEAALPGRKLPEDPDPAWMGYSIGRWEGDTLVVESSGFNDIPWLNFDGDPHSDQMHLTERYRRVDAETLEIAVTIEDPKAYKGIWVNPPKQYNLHPEWEIGEHYCVIDEELSYGDAIRIPAGQPAAK